MMEKFYTDGAYLQNNPTWDEEDVDWKFLKILPMIDEFLTKGEPLRICEIGCGGGKLLSLLAKKYPLHEFIGWDLSPDAAKFWKYDEKNISFHTGDIFKSNLNESFDMVLLIDVVEHVENPHQFLADVNKITTDCFFHMPMDLSALSVIFDSKLLYVRKNVGHIHYFTKGLFLHLLKETNFREFKVAFSDSWKDSPQKSFKTSLLNVLRYVISFINPDLNARLLGGNTLLVWAKTCNESRNDD